MVSISAFTLIICLAIGQKSLEPCIFSVFCPQ